MSIPQPCNITHQRLQAASCPYRRRIWAPGSRHAGAGGPAARAADGRGQSATAGSSAAPGTPTQQQRPVDTPAQQHQQVLLARRGVLQHLVLSAALLGELRSAPSAAGSAAAEGAEAAVLGCRGCVAAIAAIPSGKTTVLGEQQLGSGIVWDRQGHVVVPYAPLMRVQRQGTAGDSQVLVTLAAADGSVHQLPAAIIAKDAPHELIVLQVVVPAAGLCPVQLSSSEGLRVGQDAYLLAALPDASPLVSAGVVSGLARVIPASNNQAIDGVLQTDVEVGAQSLGGALLDAGGHLVGMPVVSYVRRDSTSRSSGINFALPSDLLREVVPRLIAYGSAAVRR